MDQHAPETPVDEDGFEYAVVEVFGHRSHAGRAREEERFGAKMLRIDVPRISIVPAEEGKPAAFHVDEWVTHYYGGASIFSYTPTTLETVMRTNRPYAAAGRYSLPAPDDDDDGRPF